MLTEGKIRVSDFLSVLGRIGFTVTALEEARPLMGPLYAWASAIAHQALSFAEVPWAIRLILSWFADTEDGGSSAESEVCSDTLGRTIPDGRQGRERSGFHRRLGMPGPREGLQEEQMVLHGNSGSRFSLGFHEERPTEIYRGLRTPGDVGGDFAFLAGLAYQCLILVLGHGQH